MMKPRCSNTCRMLLQNAYVPLSINDVFANVQVTQAIGTNTDVYHDRHWLLNFALVTIGMLLFLFGLEKMMSVHSKNNMKGGLNRAQHVSTISDEL